MTSLDIAPFANALVLGLSIASIWLIAAIGLTIIYGTVGVINMAHGEFIMLGAYTSYALQSSLGLPFLLCLPASFVVVALVGLVIERGLIRYLYNRPLDTLLATWGVSLVLMQGVRLIFGSDPKYIAVPEIFQSNVEVGFASLSVFRLVVLGITALIVAATAWLFYRTRFGMQVRAVMQNKEMAASFGINADRVYMTTFALGAGLAGVAGSLFGVLAIVLPTMGTAYVVQAFLVVVVGGGTLMGSVAAAGLTGELQSVFAFVTNDTFARFLLYVLIVVFLRFRPRGLFAVAKGRR
ncbi:MULTISPECIES: urea ABC transporter permease subunit UrtB [Methylorubrum]|uniref:Inner-membrane translocator n=2 Tax=Methylorubrum TaxID=2282523 RepID=B1ZCU7_METPB|nr:MULTISPECIES: urea ABC transporter permease subunit UrtB [Methylorubrum]ACB79459.1 inner-membrane translocator [Methylorubrum populi BJ001]MBA8913831.1 urea transport system permease protein [Methylorubrum thiocyanatum]PZP65880.1 MAG: urea ABC transporter permease subunit UrtB [Methylorubrum populi]GJE82562.1 High-affinity branched-chain amino acid transport system permease protein LivH [Methylorubrum thiocyanatum]